MRNRAIVGFALVGLITFAPRSVARAEEDHLEGYKIKDLNSVAPPANPYTITNEFGSESCELKKPQFFLAGSAKNGGDDPRGGTAGNFVCYKAKCTGAVPPTNEQESQFGLHSIETKKAKLVCLPVTPPPPPCAGALVGGFCWYLGATGESCDTVCTNQALSCDPATISYAGSGGTLAQCDAVMDVLYGPGAAADTLSSGSNVGCFLYAGLFAYRDPLGTTCAAAEPGLARACACS